MAIDSGKARVAGANAGDIEARTMTLPMGGALQALNPLFPCSLGVVANR